MITLDNVKEGLNSHLLQASVNKRVPRISPSMNITNYDITEYYSQPKVHACVYGVVKQFKVRAVTVAL